MFKKKKRGGDKEKKVRKKCLNERETVSYEQQILDNNRQLSRFVSLGLDTLLLTLSFAFKRVPSRYCFKATQPK